MRPAPGPRTSDRGCQRCLGRMLRRHQRRQQPADQAAGDHDGDVDQRRGRRAAGIGVAQHGVGVARRGCWRGPTRVLAWSGQGRRVARPGWARAGPRVSAERWRRRWCARPSGRLGAGGAVRCATACAPWCGGGARRSARDVRTPCRGGSARASGPSRLNCGVAAASSHGAVYRRELCKAGQSVHEWRLDRRPPGRARWWPATSRLVYGHLAGMHIGLRSVERARQRPCDLIGSLRRAVNDPVRRVGEVSNVARFDLDVRIGRSAGQ